MFAEYDESLTALAEPWRGWRARLAASVSAVPANDVTTLWAHPIQSEDEALVALACAGRLSRGVTLEVARDVLQRDKLTPWLQRPRVRAEWLRLRLFTQLRTALDQTDLESDSAVLSAVCATQAGMQDRPGAVAERIRRTERLATAPNDVPFVAYSLGVAWMGVRRWREAALHLRQAVDSAPGWGRATLALAQAHRALGEPGEAGRVLDRLLQIRCGDPTVLASRSYEAFAEHRWSDVLAMTSTANDGPDPAVWLRAISHWELGQYAEAAESLRNDAATHPIADVSNWRRGAPWTRVRVHRHIQERNMCAAAAIAMALSSFGERIDPTALFREAEGGHGLSDRQADAWLSPRGFRRVAIGVRRDTLLTALRAGLPALCVSRHRDTAHMEILIGHHGPSDTFEILDPATGLPTFWPPEVVATMFDNLGSGMSVVVPVSGGSSAMQALLAQVEADLPNRISRVSQLCLQPDVEAAERELAQIDDVDARASLYYMHSGALGEPEDRATGLQRIAESAHASVWQRISALRQLHLLQRSGQALDRPPALDTLHRLLDELPDATARTHVEFELACDEGRWERVATMAEELLDLGSSASTWWQYAVALEQLGRTNEALDARAIAMDVGEESPEVQAAILRADDETAIPRADRIERCLRFLRRHPTATHVRAILVPLLSEAGRVAEAEQVALDAVRYQPRSEYAVGLARWYYQQAHGRLDLAPGSRVAPTTVPAERLAQTATSALIFLMGQAASSERSAMRNELLVRLRRESTPIAEKTEIQAHLLASLLLDRGEGYVSADSVREWLPAALVQPKARHASDFLEQLPFEQISAENAAVLEEWLIAATGCPDADEVVFWRARLRFAQGYVREAEQLFEKLGTQRRMLQALCHRAGIAAQRDDVDLEYELLNRAIEIAPGNAAAARQLAMLCRERGALTEALAHYLRVAELRFHDPFAAAQYLEMLRCVEGPAAYSQWVSSNAHRYPSGFAAWSDALTGAKNREDTEPREGELGPPLDADVAVHRLERALGDGVHELSAELVEVAARHAPHAEIVALARAERATTSAERGTLLRQQLLRNPSARVAHEWIGGLRPERLDDALRNLIYESALTSEDRNEMGADPVAHAFRLGLRPRYDVVRAVLNALLARNHIEYAAAQFAGLCSTYPDDVDYLTMQMQLARIAGRDDVLIPAARALLAFAGRRQRLVRQAAEYIAPADPIEAAGLYRRSYETSGDPADLERACALVPPGAENAELVDEVTSLVTGNVRKNIVLMGHWLRWMPAEAPAWRLLLQALESTPTSRTPYFALNAVKHAVRRGESLPPAWERWAVQRVLHADWEAGEAVELCSALLVWAVTRNRPWVYLNAIGRSEVRHETVTSIARSGLTADLRWCLPAGVSLRKASKMWSGFRVAPETCPITPPLQLRWWERHF